VHVIVFPCERVNGEMDLLDSLGSPRADRSTLPPQHARTHTDRPTESRAYICIVSEAEKIKGRRLMNSGGAALSHIILYYDGKQDDAPRPCFVMMGVCALCQFQRKILKQQSLVLKQKQHSCLCIMGFSTKRLHGCMGVCGNATLCAPQIPIQSALNKRRSCNGQRFKPLAPTQLYKPVYSSI
jgi:hypothetical protein